MRNHRRRGLTALATVASLVSLSALAACGGDGDDEESSDGKVTITVEGWRPGDEQGTIDAVKKQAEAFMDDNPDIVVEPVEWEWTAETFATQLAGDTLPTTFRVPFTDAKGLAERQQIADVTEYVEALPYAAEFNPSVLEAAKGTDGKIYGLPTDVYGVGPALQPRRCSRRPGSTRTPRRPRGTRCASTPRRSPTRPARPATSR